MKSWRFALTFLAAVVIWSGTAQADFDTGWRAFQKGDFAAALAAWRPLAEAGDARSQFNLGTMYDRGRGVLVDPVKAAEWWRRAAEGGYARAQHNFASSLIAGEGVASDYSAAIEWLTRAS
ncbi:MAG: tetratricopeptide repeat protein, partial [Alphaproteobacteria bacterium]